MVILHFCPNIYQSWIFKCVAVTVAVAVAVAVAVVVAVVVVVAVTVATESAANKTWILRF